jgi:acyl-CoA thioesterase II
VEPIRPCHDDPVTPPERSALDALIDLLDLEAIEVNMFRGQSPNDHRQRVFGGQVAGQALVAAARTVDEDAGDGRRRNVHSLHAYFLRPGDNKRPILYQVDRIRDGRSFTTRRVVAIQHGRAIFNLSASFHVEEPGFDHQIAMPAGVPDPDTLPTFKERLAAYADQLGDSYDRERPIDMRYVRGPGSGGNETGEARRTQQVWMRTDGRLPDDPMLHACVVAYASDMTLLDTALVPHGIRWPNYESVMMASLDHAMWFHRPFRADEWLLYDQETPSSQNARGLARGSIYTRDGHLAVSVVQEGLIRPIRR